MSFRKPTEPYSLILFITRINFSEHRLYAHTNKIMKVTNNVVLSIVITSRVLSQNINNVFFVKIYSITNCLLSTYTRNITCYAEFMIYIHKLFVKKIYLFFHFNLKEIYTNSSYKILCLLSTYY